MKILLVGKNSVVAKAFFEAYSNQYVITSIGKKDDINEGSYDAVIFLAQSKDYKEAIFTPDLFNVNVELLFNTINKVEAKKFIYFSTGGVYKTNGTGHYATSSDVDVASTNPYVASKIIGELLVQANQNKFSSTIIIRPFFIYGKEQKDSMLMKSLYNRISTGEKIILNNGKGLIFNPVYAGDVALLLHHLLQSDLKGHQIFNAGGSEIISLDVIVQMLAGLLNKTPVIESNSNTETIMIGETMVEGWMPQTNLQHGLHKTFFGEK
jgi:nucleoside-diphosphate-sugar epimerase